MSNAADVHALELDFQKRPNSDAFVGLVEAYLSNKRYGDAMIVCKRGIKNQPQDPRGRLLLARVYLEQGKPPKAEQELQQLLSLFPDNLDALIMQADVYKNSGRKSDAIAMLQKVMVAQPGRTDVKEALKGLGVEDAPPPPPPPPMPTYAPPPSGPRDIFSNDPEPEFQRQDVLLDDNPRRPTTSGGFIPPKKPGSAKTLLITVLVLVIGLVSWLGYYINHVNQVRKIDLLLREAKPQIEKNTYISLREALQTYQKVLEVDDKNVTANAAIAYFEYWLYGDQLVADAKPLAEKALATAQLASEKEDTAYRIAARGMAKLYANDPNGAIGEIDPKIKAGAAAPVISLVLADAYLAIGKESEAKEALQRAAALSAADNQVLSREGEGNLDEGKYEGAKGYFDQVLSQESGHPGALIGRILANLGRKQEAPEAADKDFEKLSSIPAEYLTPRWQAGMLWSKGLLDLRRGKKEDAQKSFDEANKIPGAAHNVRWLAVRAKVYGTMGMHQLAVEDYKAVLAKRPNFRPAEVGLTMAYSSLNKPAEAMTFVDQLLAKDPTDVEILLVRARALRTQNKLDDAITAYNKVLAQQKSNFDAKIELAQLYRQKRDFPKAQEVLTTMLKANEAKGHNYAVALVELGRTYLDAGDLERAKPSFTEAITKDQTYPDSYYFLGRTLKGKPQKEALARYVSMAPSGAYAADAERMFKTGK